MAKADIATRADIDQLVRAFYSQATVDPLIGHFFTEVAKLDLDTHMPKIADFWETVLLGNVQYQGRPMMKHLMLHAQSPLQMEHIARWIELWEKTVQSMFEGPLATESIRRAHLFGQTMFYKTQHMNNTPR
ncbi:group III truncated hemoglobin [Pontibacter sp. G13]|uniref:group III truncated hemoglobin n=1 Tax=Pontibacter sp. G13 TaxID=3074898 RepID=UPI00288AF7F2|nr:group III truncated hemoglobin [Pontibacter sp. G13]WNJ18440.1 group III truncated hemoglobin [Pontibacter sp. G13]